MDLISRLIKMGMTMSNSRNDETLLEKLGNLPEKLTELRDLPERVQVQIQAKAEDTVEILYRELHALFPPETKEGDTERDEEVEVRFVEFMKGGGCKESFTHLEDCLQENERIFKCRKHIPMLMKCMRAHSAYYQPIIAIAKSAEEKLTNEALTLFCEEESRRKLRGD